MVEASPVGAPCFEGKAGASPRPLTLVVADDHPKQPQTGPVGRWWGLMW